MKNGQRKHPLLLGVLYGTAIYGLMVLIEVYGISDATVTMLIIPFILFIFALISQMRNIASAKKEEDVDYCLNTYFIYKYITMPVGLIAAGIVGTLIVTIIWMIIKCLEEPLIIILIFFLVVFIIAIIPCSLIVFTLVELPCFISMDCVLGITQKKYGITSVERRAHFLLQMIPVLDIIDGLYISIKYWNRGRRLAIVSAAFTLSEIVLVLWIYLANRFI
ncbi:MAG: hypothetical protein KH170_04945 [Lachnospiraceae bacterium oral taxon 082]|nr:hypothetical protein [Lachnospiraceae bacterium oral taxon 082]